MGKLIEECWPAAIAEQLRAEAGLPAGCLVAPGWARGIERDLCAAIRGGMSRGDARSQTEAAWRFRLGLSNE